MSSNISHDDFLFWEFQSPASAYSSFQYGSYNTGYTTTNYNVGGTSSGKTINFNPLLDFCNPGNHR